MKYRKFIETYFLIDEPKTGELVPFKFNKVQAKFYDYLVDLGIEEKGLNLPVRENILKARREGFSSLILALFAADDILSENPTISQVISYKDDGTKVFRMRYKNYVLSYFAKKKGVTIDKIKDKEVFESWEGGEYVLRHNRARFLCGTASARTGERGGVLQKLLFSEAAFYPDTEKLTAKEIVEGTLRQVDISSGWVFIETTGRKGGYYERFWKNSVAGLSRFKPTFYGWREFYDDEQMELIRSEFQEEDMFKQEYPEVWEDAFISAELQFTSAQELTKMIENDTTVKKLVFWLAMKGTNYIDQCEIIKHNLESLAKEHHGHNLYAGIDVAKDADQTVMTVLMDTRFTPQGGVKGIAIDSTGIGDFMPDWFERNARWYVHPVKFSRPSKDIMYKLLRTVIKKQTTSLPLIKEKDFTSQEAKDFWVQMIDLQKEIIGSMLVVSHPDGKDYHDDYCDSWALAETVYDYFNPTKSKVRPPSTDLQNPLKQMLDRRNEKIGKVEQTKFR